jgi:hypothetical protein
MKNSHFFLDLVSQRKPKSFSVMLDGTIIFKAELLENRFKTLIDLPVKINKKRWLMAILFDNDPTPVYTIHLGGEIG